jgi:hypothetical protein
LPDFSHFDNRTPLCGTLPRAFRPAADRQRRQVARHWIDMTNITQYQYKKTRRVAASVSPPPPPKSPPNWKPEPCGLSREELRKLVAQIMG